MEAQGLPSIDLTPYQTLDETSFRRALDQLTEAYHNGQALINDQSYDDLVQLFEDRFGSYADVGAAPRGEKVVLPYYMGSLRKVEDEKQFQRWMTNYPGPYVIQDKGDGVALEYFISGGLYRLYTRGDGKVGVDVSHMIDDLRLPKLPYDIAVRAEVIMFKETFARVGTGFANPRNMVSGLVNSKESYRPDIARQLHFLAFRVMESDQTPEIQILQLKAVGFETPWAVSTPTLNFPLLEMTLKERKAISPYEIDGVVIYQNKVETYPEGENPRHVIAYKGESESKLTRVLNVIWEASMHRKLIPVVVYEEVFLSGANLTQANGYNARFIGVNGIGPGAIVRVTRSKETIPKITRVIEKTNPGYPDPAIHGQYIYDGVDIILLEDNAEVKAAKMEHFLSKLEIEGMGPGRVKLLVDSGIISTTELLQTPMERFATIPGFGSTISYQLSLQLQEKTKNVPLALVMASSTLFPGLGEKRLQLIVSAIPDVLQRVSDPTLASQIQQIGGFNTLAYNFVNNLPKFVAWLREHPSITLKEMAQGPSTTEPATLKGMTVVFSGFRSKDLEDKVAQRGGRVTTSISKRTSLLVMADINDKKGKAEQAITLGIPLISRAEFEMRYLG